MSKTWQEIPDPSSEDPEPMPDWLEEALRTWNEADLFERPGIEPPEGPGAFTTKCRESAEVALALARLECERTRIGFVPLSLSNYLDGLAKAARVDLGPLLEAFGIEGLLATTRPSAHGLARLCKRLGFSLRETLAHVRIDFAEALDIAPLPMLTARRRGPERNRSPLEECEEELTELAREYVPEHVRLLQSIESGIYSFWEEKSDEHDERDGSV